MEIIVSIKSLTVLAATLGFIGSTAFAVGSNDDTPPKPTGTTQICERGMVYDAQSKTCLNAKSEILDDDTRYTAARELAYAGQYENALTVLASAENQNDPRILNYYGFTNRKLGNTDIAMQYYQAALDIAPEYILARSYMGQGMLAAGDRSGAQKQLAIIKDLGGQKSWAYSALAQALHGSKSNY